MFSCPALPKQRQLQQRQPLLLQRNGLRLSVPHLKPHTAFVSALLARGNRHFQNPPEKEKKKKSPRLFPDQAFTLAPGFSRLQTLSHFPPAPSQPQQLLLKLLKQAWPVWYEVENLILGKRAGRGKGRSRGGGLGAREKRIRQGEVSLHPMSKPPFFGAPGPSRCLPTPTPGTAQCDTDAPSSLRHHLHFKVPFIAG